MQLYSNCISLNAGGTCFLYTDPGLSVKASAGKYSDGTNCFTVDANGLITASTACVSGITITVDYDDSSCTADSINVKKNGSTAANLTSFGTTSFSAVNGDVIDITVTPGSGKVGCNVASFVAYDSSGTFLSNDNIGVGGQITGTFTVGAGNSGNINIEGLVGGAA